MRDNANRTDLPDEAFRQHQQLVQSAAAWASFSAANTVRGILMRGITGSDPTTIAINLGAKLLSTAAGGYFTGFIANGVKQIYPSMYKDDPPPTSQREAERKMIGAQMKFDDDKRKMGVEYGKAIGGAVGIIASLAFQTPDFVSKGIDVNEMASNVGTIIKAGVAGGAPTAALLGLWFIGQHLGAYVGNRLAQKPAPLTAADLDIDRLIAQMRASGADNRDAYVVDVVGRRNADMPQVDFIKTAQALHTSWRAAFKEDGSIDRTKCEEFKTELKKSGVSPEDADELDILIFQNAPPDRTDRALLNLASPFAQLTHPMAGLVTEWRAKVKEDATDDEKQKFVAEAANFSKKDFETLTHAVLVYGVLANKPGTEEHDMASWALENCPARADLDLDKPASKHAGGKDLLDVLKLIRSTTDKLKISSNVSSPETLFKTYRNRLQDAQAAGGLKFLNEDYRAFRQAEAEAENLQDPSATIRAAVGAPTKSATPQAVLALRRYPGRREQRYRPQPSSFSSNRFSGHYALDGSKGVD